MHTIWFLIGSEVVARAVECPSIAVAQVVWDALSAQGYEMASTRP